MPLMLKTGQLFLAVGRPFEVIAAQSALAQAVQSLRESNEPPLTERITASRDSSLSKGLQWCTYCQQWHPPGARTRTVYLYSEWWTGSEGYEGKEHTHLIHEVCPSCYTRLSNSRHDPYGGTQPELKLRPARCNDGNWEMLDGGAWTLIKTPEPQNMGSMESIAHLPDSKLIDYLNPLS